MESENSGKIIRYKSEVHAFVNIVEKYFPERTTERMLDLGCGCGLEALTLQNETGIPTIGIDVIQDFDSEALEQIELRGYDGHSIPYPDAYFDGVYSFHVLEHVQNLDRLIAEVSRVLKPGGFAYFGVPNRSRLIAYFGTPGKHFSGKVRQNLIDVKHRLLRKFSNELGAHAGFSEKGLVSRLSGYFSKVLAVTSDYYCAKWQHSKGVLRWLLWIGPQKIIWPSVYVLCVK